MSPPLPDPRAPGRFHYAGLGGSGMSALAQFQAMLGGRASGSDRSFDRGERAAARAQLERLGIGIHPQDGSGVTVDCAALVVSTAVEEQVPDVAAARRLGVPILHRSELLAHFVDTFRTIAVTGTSGKSTVVAMVFEILRACGRRPSVITGGDLASLQAEGLWGNAWYGGSDLLVVEADESDGSLVRYHPAVGVVLNLQKDHKEMDVVAAMFETFRRQTRETFVVGDGANLAAIATRDAGGGRGGDPRVADTTGAGHARSEHALVFGFGSNAEVRAEHVELGPEGSCFEVDGVTIRLAVPGRFNVENALASIATCQALGVEVGEAAAALASFGGVGRRFQRVGAAHGIEIVDDFAHNPAKIAAALETAQRRAGRVLAVYQPHGYGPTRFLRPDFVDTFSATLRPDDRLWLLEVYYAGGTAQRDFSSADIVAEIAARGVHAEFAASRDWLIERLARAARPGDLILVMGARDPSLTELAEGLLRAIRSSPAVGARES